jgi:hypothetical protein
MRLMKLTCTSTGRDSRWKYGCSTSVSAVPKPPMGRIVKINKQLDYDERPSFRHKQCSDFCQPQRLLAISYVTAGRPGYLNLRPLGHFKNHRGSLCENENELYFALLEPNDTPRWHASPIAALALSSTSMFGRAYSPVTCTLRKVPLGCSEMFEGLYK